MKNFNYILLGRILLIGLNTFEVFGVLLALFGVLSAIQFSLMFLLYYAYRIKGTDSDKKLLLFLYILSRMLAFGLAIYPAIITYGLYSCKFGMYAAGILLLELSLEIKLFRNLKS